ncbi:MAG TPA: hypothetical protein VHN20_18250 [Beijerinckiaceae bacterium]|nr:hypothetical protein [Beijerinckiaceae bacterium]
MTNAHTLLPDSRLYEPVALLRGDEETLIVARIGMKTSKRLTILTPDGQPAWPHEPFGSLSDVAWSLRAHERHLLTPEPVGANPGAARTLARLLKERE